MILKSRMMRASFLLLLILASCINQPPRMRQDRAVDIAWDTIRPNTSSGNPDNWEVSEARLVTGREVVGEFGEARFINCPGPIPPENQAIKASSEYWYLKIVPAPVELLTKEESVSEANSPAIPEPLINEVLILIDAFDGVVVARKFTCQTY